MYQDAPDPRHLTVNHSENFVDPHIGAHTNTIESTWRAVKRSLRSSHTQKQHFAAHLAEYIWRWKNAGARCKFVRFLLFDPVSGIG